MLPIVTVMAASLLGAVLILLGSAWFLPRLNRPEEPTAPEAVFLFEGDEIGDATPGALRLLGDAEQGTCKDVVKALERRFPELGRSLDSLSPGGQLRINAQGGQGWLEAERWGENLRLTLQGAAPGPADMARLEALETEVALLRGIAEAAPQLIWAEDSQGRISWTNAAYLALAERAFEPEDNRGWPPPRLFDLAAHGDEAAFARRRVAITLPDQEEKSWFSVSRLPRGEAGTLFIAEDAGPLVHAEVARRNFVQTLTKTFAQLPTGLAIFDRSRRLVLFNPALLDLTGLPAEFLASRPSLHAVLDRLRDRRMVPETRDFGQWRDQLVRIEAEAEEGTYCETWPLSGGQTFSVTGRPHPDGAVAFLFEDISSELRLTRRFRTDIEFGQAVLDALEPAMAAFSASGVLTMTNSAFARMFETSPDGQLNDVTLAAATETWARRFRPSPFWGDLRSFAERTSERAAWEDQLILTDGRIFGVRVSPLPGGGILCAFVPRSGEVAPTAVRAV